MVTEIFSSIYILISLLSNEEIFNNKILLPNILIKRKYCLGSHKIRSYSIIRACATYTQNNNFNLVFLLLQAHDEKQTAP